MDVRTSRFPVGAGTPAIEVRNPAGSVTVEALEGAEEFEVRIEPLDAAARDLLDRVDVGTSGARLRVDVPERRLFRTPSFAVSITCPPGADVRVAVASADAELRGRLGSLALTGASGDFVVEHGGDLQLRSASGDARVGTVDGDATLASASGDLRVRRAGGSLELRTASGDVAVDEATADVTITTASGDITVGSVSSGTVQLKTVSGDASVGVAPGRRVWLDLSSVSGRMESALDEDAGDSDEGPAQVSIGMRSVSGDLRIRRATVVPGVAEA